MGAFSTAFSTAFDVESPDDSPDESPGFISCGDVCWPAPIVCDECCSLDLETVDPAIRDMAAQWAARFLWAATGKQYGGCPRTWRPCKEKCAPQINCCGGFGGPIFQSFPQRLPFSYDWTNLTCNRCVKGCQCSEVSEVILPNVAEVLNVRIDGVDFDPCGMVAVYDKRRVVRTDGREWPACQELSKVDGPGTWSITVIEGECPPAGAAWMTGTLMCEVLKACMKRDDCQLPRRLQTITRQGVSMTFNDNFEGLARLHTGIWELDAWIESTNYNLAVQPRVRRPDGPQHSELTWPKPGQHCQGSGGTL